VQWITFFIIILPHIIYNSLHYSVGFQYPKRHGALTEYSGHSKFLEEFVKSFKEIWKKVTGEKRQNSVHLITTTTKLSSLNTLEEKNYLEMTSWIIENCSLLCPLLRKWGKKKFSYSASYLHVGSFYLPERVYDLA